MHFILALLTTFMPTPEAKAEEALDIPNRMAPSPGFWQTTAPERQADELSLACRWAAPKAAMAKAQELLAAKKEAQAKQCLDEALQENPRDQGLVDARQKMEPKGKNDVRDAAPPVGRGDAGRKDGGERSAEQSAQGGEHAGTHSVQHAGADNAEHGDAHSAEHGDAHTAEQGAHGAEQGAHGAEHGGEHGGEPAYKLGLGYLHAQAGKDDKLTDMQLQAAHHWDQGFAVGAVHLLHKTAKEHKHGEEAPEAAEAASTEPTEAGAALAEAAGGAAEKTSERDTALDLTWSQSWGANRLGLLLGYSFGDGEVSYKNAFGLLYERLLPGETTLGAQLRSLKFADGHATGFDVYVNTHFSHHGLIGGQIALLTGAYKGSAGTLRLGYEDEGLEVIGFVTKGHGIPSHPYLRPESTHAFTTYGAEFAKHLGKHWALNLGAERRGESKHRFEVEFSGGLAWER